MAWMRALWFLALAAALLLDIAGSVFVLRDAYRFDPAFGRLSLVSQIENDGSVTFETMPALAAAPSAVPPGSRIVSIRGEPVARNTPIWDLAKLADAKDGELISVGFLVPTGQMVTHRFTASGSYIDRARQSVPLRGDVRMIARMAISLLTCLALIACAALLFMRRPQDPVAMLFSFSFLLFAGVIDPPLLMWLATGMGNVFDAYSTLAWLLLVLGLAVFPDGEFNPRPLRWLLVLAPMAAFALSFDELPVLVGSTIAFVAPLFLLASHVMKYRRLQPGIERQQVKWAAFGFGSGLVLLTAAFYLTESVSSSSTLTAIYGLIILALFSGGFLAMALGLLVSLLRFRLWEADRVISRSAISAAVTVVVAIVWAASLDLVKMAVEWTLGEENETVSTLAGAALAAGIFAPTQTMAMRWARTRLQGDQARMGRLISRLAIWRATETPEEIAIRTLSALNAAIHCSSAALLVDTARGLQLLASRDVEQPELLNNPHYDCSLDKRFGLNVPLEDEDGPMGTLLIGPRDDSNRYSDTQLGGLSELSEPLAEALRAALKRVQHAEIVNLKLGSVEERLARLEQGRTNLSPT